MIMRHDSLAFTIKKHGGKFAVFDENYGLTPLEKIRFHDFVKFIFL